ncbi:DUF1543 domain-containing protein [Rheinheimera sp.]|uniref:DUF1543 domain-containing protein n=1 Tax=Rheinheimera sp. TaxID=1869214 RepID=UPI002FDC8D4C
MLQQKKEDKVLYIVMLGGRHAAAKIEVHDVVFVSGDNLQQLYPQLREQWFGISEGLHIDSWMAVDGVEQYKVGFSNTAPAAGEPRLFFINLGGYQYGHFGEEHRYLLVVAKDKVSAKQKGKTMLAAQWDKPHTDNLWDLDDCIAIDNIGGRYISLSLEPHQGIKQQNDYILL